MKSLLQLFLIPLIGGSYLSYASSTQTVDTHTPNNFLFERESRVVTEYMENVLKRGDANDLLVGVTAVHTDLKNGLHTSELEVISVNLNTLISVTEHLIATQEYADNLNILDDNEYQKQKEVEYMEFRTEVDKLVNNSSIQEEGIINYRPPEHDKIYNEHKKDLLDEAYDMLETLEGRMNP